MGELMQQVMNGGPGVIPLNQLSVERQAFISDAAMWTRHEAAWVLEAIVRDVTMALSNAHSIGETHGSPATVPQARQTVLHELCDMYHTVKTWDGDEAKITERDAREILKWLGHGPAFWTIELGRYAAVAARQRAIIWASCPISAALSDIAAFQVDALLKVNTHESQS